jgi:bifunctional ADP-heptose synthase (sugar kinase/adenylyltransferase)
MKQILVIGETCIDEFIYCDTTRLCPEGPVPIVKPIYTTINDGMSGNVVNNIKCIDSTAYITHVHQSDVIKKIRYVDKKSNHLFIRIDEEKDDISKCSLESIEQLQKNFYDLVIVSDYQKGFLSDEQLPVLAKLGTTSVLDTKRLLTDTIIENFTFVKLNEQEAYQNRHLTLSDKLIVTLGSRGTKYLEQIFETVEPVETIDVSGAGDTFTSAFALKYVETNDVTVSINFGNTMAAKVVRKRGVATP